MNEKELRAIIKLRDEMSRPLRNIQGNMEELNRATDQSSNKLKSLSKNMKNMAGGFSIAGGVVTGAVGGILGASTKVGVEFEASMSKVQAIMGATPAQLEQLEKSARDAGAKTTKSASESANALEYMGLAGWSVKESQDALMPVLRLSEAGAMDLGRTSDLVTDSMSSLGLKMEDIGQTGLNKYLDMIAKTSNSSNTSIEQLMEGLIIVGGTAKNLNVPMEELNAIMGIMANRGLKGTESATALNSVLINMTTGTGQAGKAMEELGLSAFNADGSFKGLAKMFDDLRVKTKDMSDEQKNYYLAMIGGKTQVDALQKILDGVGDEYGELKDKIKDSEGALQTMSDVMNDNTKGGIAQLKSALEEAGISIYTSLKPAIAEVTEHIQKAVDWFNNLDESTKQNIVKFGLLALGAGVVLLGIGLLLPIIASAVTVFGALSSAGLTLSAIMAFLSSPIMLVIGVMVLLTAGVLALREAWERNFGGIRDKTQVVVDFVKEKINSIKGVFENVKNACISFGDSIKNTWNSIKNFLAHPIQGTINLFKNESGSSSSKAKTKKKNAFGGTIRQNDTLARLHEGERVLTKRETNQMDRGMGYGSKGINIQISNLTVREDADVKKIARQLVKEMNKSLAGGIA